MQFYKEYEEKLVGGEFTLKENLQEVRGKISGKKF